jgi:hypothetical protein
VKSSNTNIMKARLISWSVISTGLGIGLLVTSFIGENDPKFTQWGIGMISIGIVILLGIKFLSRGKYEK